jgi:hypothetical protein
MRKKARGFVVDARSGKPAGGIVVVATAEYDDGNAVPIGTLASDAAGYVSFDVASAFNGQAPAHIRIEELGSGGAVAEVDISEGQPKQGELFVLQVASAAAGPCRGCRNGSPCLSCQEERAIGAEGQSQLPAVQSPDQLDWTLSPSSFVSDTPVIVDDGDCQKMLPTQARKFATNEYRFTQVVRRSPSSSSKMGTREGSGGSLEPGISRLFAGAPTEEQGLATEFRAARLLPPPPPGNTTSPTEVAINGDALEIGQVLSFKQTWWPLGHSIGRIIYSLALAPCESVDIAVIDWSRSDEAVRRDRITSKENLAHVQRRDRTIDDIVDATLNESQGGWSLQAGMGMAQRGSVDATIPIEAVNLSLSAGHGITTGFGVGTAESWGNRDLTASSLQDLHDTVVQNTGVMRQLNGTVVVQSSQQERNYLETRTVTNHNHCHALSIEYHEVLQHLRVETRYESRRWAVLIPYKLLAFDWRLALRYRTILQAVLLDSSLAECFDAIVRLHFCASAYDIGKHKPTEEGKGLGTPKEGEHKASPVKPGISRYELTLSTGNRNTWGQIWVHVGLKTGEWRLLHFKERKQDGGEEIWANQDYVKDITSGDAIGVDPTQVERVKVGWFEADGSDEWLFKGIKVRYQVEEKAGLAPAALMNERKEPFLVDFDNSWGQVKEWTGAVRPVSRPSEEPKGEDPAATPKTEPEEAAPAYTKEGDTCCEQRLIVHLQANVGYYNRALWLLQDPTEREMMLDKRFAGHSEIKNAINPTPVAVIGNFVAYTFNGAAAPEPELNKELDPPTSIVSLPTRGLFAETHLSNCNACEKRDTTRYWNWAESPCPKPPQITGVTPGPRGEPITLEQGSLPTPIVNVLNAPDAPDPTGLAAALNLLGTPNIFRDMSTKAEVSKLLDGLISGAVSLAEAKDMAAKAKQSIATGGGSTATRSAPSETNASNQIDKLDAIKYASDSGLITDKQKQDAATGVLGGEPLGGAGTGGSGPGIGGAIGPPPKARPCCILAPTVGIENDNLIDIPGLGTHWGGNEESGLVYTDRGGFIDLGHLRDLVDITKYVYDQIEMHAGSPATVATTHGVARFLATPPKSEWSMVARAIAFDDSFGYEIFTYDIRDVGAHNSSFSPEDLPSNHLGTLVAQRALAASGSFSTAVTAEIIKLLTDLGARSKTDTRAAFNKINGRWVSFSNRFSLFNNDYLKRRNFTGIPWPAGMPGDKPPPGYMTIDFQSVEKYYEFTLDYDGVTIPKSKWASELTRIRSDAKKPPPAGYGPDYDKP